MHTPLFDVGVQEKNETEIGIAHARQLMANILSLKYTNGMMVWECESTAISLSLSPSLFSLSLFQSPYFFLYTYSY